MLVVSCHSQEEGFFGGDELRDVPQAVRLPLGVVADRQGFERLSRERQELQLVSSSRRGEPGGVQEDVGGDSWELWTAQVILCLSCKRKCASL